MRWGVLFGCAVAVAAAGAGCGSSSSLLHGDAGNDTPSAAGGAGGAAGATGTGGGTSAGGAKGTGGAPGSGGSSAGGAPGSGGSGAGGAGVIDAGTDKPGVPCGSNVCTGATYCCNPSCGICAPGGSLCAPLVCDADGGSTDTRSSFDALGCAAIPALDSNCGGARPPHYYVCVLSTLAAPCTVVNIGNVTNTFCCP